MKENNENEKSSEKGVAKFQENSLELPKADHLFTAPPRHIQVFSFVAILIFTLREQIWWIPGLVLAAGSFLGAVLGVRFTLRLNEKILKWILLLMVSCLSLYTVFD